MNKEKKNLTLHALQWEGQNKSSPAPFSLTCSLWSASLCEMTLLIRAMLPTWPFFGNSQTIISGSTTPIGIATVKCRNPTTQLYFCYKCGISLDSCFSMPQKSDAVERRYIVPYLINPFFHTALTQFPNRTCFRMLLPWKITTPCNSQHAAQMSFFQIGEKKFGF